MFEAFEEEELRVASYAFSNLRTKIVEMFGQNNVSDTVWQTALRNELTIITRLHETSLIEMDRRQVAKNEAN